MKQQEPRPVDTPTRLACGCPRTHLNRACAGGFGLRYTLNLPGCTQGRHHHPEARIVLSFSSNFGSRYGDETVQVPDSAALFRPAGEDHEDRYPRPTATLALLLPAEAPAAALSRPFVQRDPAFAGMAAELRREMHVSDTAGALVMEGLAWLITSRLLHGRPLAERGAPRWIATVRERVEAEYAAPPTLAELGRMVGRDAAYVAATFKRVYGGSVGAYVRQQRLWQARRRMDAEPETSLTEVALACGYADQSHFARHFKQLFALTPGEYRSRQGAVQAGVPQPA